MHSDPRRRPRRRPHASVLAACAVAALTAAACQREGAPAGRARVATAPSATDSALGRVYRSRLVFLGRDPDSLMALVIHTVATAVPGPQLAHGLYGWVASAVGWDPFLAYEWRGAPMRAPSRLMPHGSLHLFIADDGTIQALAYDSARTHFRLTVGAALATWPRAAALRLSLRRATLQLDGRRYRGALLISRDTRATTDTAAGTDTTRTPAIGGDVAGLLTDGRAYTVLAQTPPLAPLALTVRIDRQPPDTSLSTLRLAPILSAAAAGPTSVADPASTDGDGAKAGATGGPGAGGAGAGTAADAPAAATRAAPDSVVVGWRVLNADSASLGELRRLSAGWTGISEEPGFRRFEGVRGRVVIDGRRRRVIGVIEHGRD